MTQPERDISGAVDELAALYSTTERSEIQSWPRTFVLRELLGNIINNLPKNGREFGTAGELFGDGFEKPSPEVRERREKSEHRQIYVDKLKVLLEYSDSTQSYKDFIVDFYDYLYQKGLQTVTPWAEPYLELFYSTIGFQDLDGGLFVPELVPELEERAYRLAQGVIKNKGLEGETEDERLRVGRYEAMSPKWRKEFKELHGFDLPEAA